MGIPGSAAPFLLAKPRPYLIERSLRFNSSDSAYLSRTPSTAGNRKTWTYSLWAKLSYGATDYFLRNVNSGSSDSGYILFSLSSLGDIRLSGWATNWLQTTAVYRDPSAWYHIVLTADTTQVTASNRLKLYVNGSQVTQFATANYPSQNLDLPINATELHDIGVSADFYLADVHLIDGQALDPTSFGFFDSNGIWQPKAYTGTYPGNSFHLTFSDSSTAAALGTDTSGNGNDWTVNNIVPNSAIYSPYYSLSSGGTFYNNDPNSYGADNLFDGSITSAVLLAPGTTITYTFPIGIAFSSSFEVYYTDQSAVSSVSINGVSQSINNNYPTREWLSVTGVTSPVTSISWTGGGADGPYIYAVRVDGVSIIVDGGPDCDSLVDVPTNGTETDTGLGNEVRGNYCTFSPVDSTSGITLTDGNLRVGQLAGADQSTCGTFGVSSGKWYWEVQCTSGGHSMVGVADLGAALDLRQYNDTGGLYYYQSTGGLYGYLGGSFANTPYGSSFLSASDIVGVALDMENGDVTFYKNGVSQGIANTSTLLGKIIAPSLGNGGVIAENVVNFGQRPFAYTAPSGFKALCTANLPSTTITTSGSYTGNGVADGPFVFLNGAPTAMTIGGNAVTFGTDADKLSNGFKIRTTSTTYNLNASVYNYSITSTGAPFKTARAQSN